MTPRDLHERASLLFLELRDLPAGDRERRLAETAVGDHSLHREVLSLLEHDFGEVDGGNTGASDPLRGRVISDGEHAAGPSRIGPYTVLRRIGSGGSGVVMLAEQHEPVRRRVAIKIVPHAAVSPDFAARFEFERRALERTEHPNIARILDAGRTNDGLPYLVMDFVEGSPITEYCRTHATPLSGRISLILEVADAVQHAHQRGVIHRDLKPGNILVSDTSGRPMARVLDFGIAKPIPERFDVDSPPTSGLPMGTPAYMAPEQTGGQVVDTRADVYAIGAVLYELVCGRPPIDVAGDPLDVLRRIRDSVPKAASALRTQMAMNTTESLSRPMLADLDCILAKALEKDPSRRYPTVAALSEDLNRLIRRQPIEARQPTLRYRAARFAQRNRLLVASLTAVLVTVVVGVVGLTASLLEAQHQRREAVNQRDAQQEINQFLTDDLLAAVSPDDQGPKVTALELLDRASRRVDQRFANRPLIAAAIHHTLGNSFMELGRFDDADRHLQQAIKLRRDHAGVNAPDTIHSEIAAGALLARRQRMTEAHAALIDTIQRGRLILDPNDPVLYTALNDLGIVAETLDKGHEAVGLLQEALAGRIRLLGAHHPMVLATMGNLAQAYDRLGQVERSLQMQIEALNVADALADQPPMTILGLCNNIGATYQDLNRDKEAAPYLRRASDLADQWLGPDNPGTILIQGNLAGLESKLGDPLHAAELYQKVVDAQTRAIGPDAADTLIARHGYWSSLNRAKRSAEAAAGFSVLLGDSARALGAEHWLTIQTRASLARALIDDHRPDEARPNAQQAAAQFLALYGADHARTRTAAAMVEEIAAAARAATTQPR